MEKIINYINEPSHNLIVDIELGERIEHSDYGKNIKFRYIENGEVENNWSEGWLVEENGKNYLYNDMWKAEDGYNHAIIIF